MKNKLWMIVCFVIALSVAAFASVKTEVRKIATGFYGVEVATHGDLTIKLGDRVELVVEADEDILPRIITEVRGKMLVIRSDDDSSGWFSQIFSKPLFNRKSHIRYSLTVPKGQLNCLTTSSHGAIMAPELTGEQVTLELSSHGNITVDALQAKSVRLVLSSHGSLKIAELHADSLQGELTSHGRVQIFAGTVKTQRVSLSSHGDYLAEWLESDSGRFELSSHGGVKAYVKELLQASLSSHGELRYRGNPRLDIPSDMHDHVRAIH